jgi:UTP---glucose-1-phosphate uridylyltransferase
VRQISNPMASTDCTLLALAGTGHAAGRAFGFASCDRCVGAAEGMNVLRRQRVPVATGEDASSAGNGAGANGAGQRWEYEYGVTNVEYTEFQRLGIKDQAVQEGSSQSCFPANTNILYVGAACSCVQTSWHSRWRRWLLVTLLRSRPNLLRAWRSTNQRQLLHAVMLVRAGLQPAAAAVREGLERCRHGVDTDGGASLPGMIFNLKKQITYTPAGEAASRSVQAGRMECTMQNLADSLTQRHAHQLDAAGASALDTFVVFNERRYVTSSAKRARVPGSDKIHQTPEGSFLDLMRNARDMLAVCGVDAPPLGSNAEYVAGGCVPAFVFLFHPALGPLWHVVAEKVQGGALAPRAEVHVELAELCWRDVSVDGSLRVLADQPVGHRAGAGGGGGVAFSDACARVRLEGVTVRNAGVDCAAAGTCFWKQAVARRERCDLVLRGRSEFVARGVTLAGDLEFEVPDGFCMTVRAGQRALPSLAEVAL